MDEKINFITIAHVGIMNRGTPQYLFMKDAAVLGGLGCIGKNNMLVSPEFGPRIRLRVMLMNVDLPSTGIADFDPCADCRVYCKKICPQKAFERKIDLS